jgi:hypothetical protein
LQGQQGLQGPPGTQAQELQNFYNSLGSNLDYYLLGGVPNAPRFNNNTSDDYDDFPYTDVYLSSGLGGTTSGYADIATPSIRFTGGRNGGQLYEYYDPDLGRYVTVSDTRY